LIYPLLAELHQLLASPDSCSIKPNLFAITNKYESLATKPKSQASPKPELKNHKMQSKANEEVMNEPTVATVNERLKAFFNRQEHLTCQQPKESE